ncbi:hypothetical protein [Butyrivibrio fibrisolvens]|uniref:hypothetical protein n=3 Tax=Butyrivibrio fibrisolvens TaxID=831 RepID=UPI0012BCE6AA|nr:hypothetical protein [Butyrivibrio fibrisolvens]
MCDEDSCEGLKSSMKAAGENARNVHSAISSVESILASLETDFAKFDYSSYTQPIKEQTQKVAERTEMYNTAVTRYEHKTKELDHTVSNALKLATPDFVPAPLDPSCLGIGDEIHFGDSKITGSLEEYITAKIDGELDEAQIKDILSMLFDKEHVDISEYSEEDFGMAFIKLSEEKKRAMLMEMGYSKEQIDSILDSCKGNKAVTVGNSIGRTLIEKIADKDGNKYGRLGKTGKASTLGLAGIKKPGQFNTDFAKTNAETYDDNAGSFGRASQETKKEHEEKQKEKQEQTNSNSTDSCVTPEEMDKLLEEAASGNEESRNTINDYISSTPENVGDWDIYRAKNLAKIHSCATTNQDTDLLERLCQEVYFKSSYYSTNTPGDDNDRVWDYDDRKYYIAKNTDAIKAVMNELDPWDAKQSESYYTLNRFLQYDERSQTRSNQHYRKDGSDDEWKSNYASDYCALQTTVEVIDGRLMYTVGFPNFFMTSRVEKTFVGVDMYKLLGEDGRAIMYDKGFSDEEIVNYLSQNQQEYGVDEYFLVGIAKSETEDDYKKMFQVDTLFLSDEALDALYSYSSVLLMSEKYNNSSVLTTFINGLLNSNDEFDYRDKYLNKLTTSANAIQKTLNAEVYNNYNKNNELILLSYAYEDNVQLLSLYSSLRYELDNDGYGDSNDKITFSKLQFIPFLTGAADSNNCITYHLDGCNSSDIHPGIITGSEIAEKYDVDDAKKAKGEFEDTLKNEGYKTAILIGGAINPLLGAALSSIYITNSLGTGNNLSDASEEAVGLLSSLPDNINRINALSSEEKDLLSSGFVDFCNGAGNVSNTLLDSIFECFSAYNQMQEKYQRVGEDTFGSIIAEPSAGENIYFAGGETCDFNSVLKLAYVKHDGLKSIALQENEKDNVKIMLDNINKPSNTNNNSLYYDIEETTYKNQEFYNYSIDEVVDYMYLVWTGEAPKDNPDIKLDDLNAAQMRRCIEILSQAKNDMDASTSSDFDYEEAVVWGEK